MAGDVLVTLGWRAVGKRGLAFEAFCDPPHRDVVQQLSSIGAGKIAAIGQMRWSFDAKGVMRALDDDTRIPAWLKKKAGALANVVINDMVTFLDDMCTLEREEVTAAALTMLVNHDHEIADAIRRGVMAFDDVVAVDCDHGSPIAMTAAPAPEPEQFEYDEDGWLVRATFPVRNLPSAVVRWDVNRVRITLPGVPCAGKLAGWAKPQSEQAAGSVRRMVMTALTALVDVRDHRPFGETADAIAR